MLVALCFVIDHCYYKGCNDCYTPQCLTDTAIFTNYAKFHQQTLRHREKVKFLIYVCDHDLCGGYGNRIQGITMSLLFAILSNRTFLIQMKRRFDINRLLHPNAIKWNDTGYLNTKYIVKDFQLMDDTGLEKNWPSFSEELFNSSNDIIMIRTNLGLSTYFKIFDDKWNKTFHNWFNITYDYDILTYGCVARYLFTYDETVTDAIDKEIQDLGLTPGSYVSAHFRSYQDSPVHSHPSPYPYLNCAVMLANEMTNRSNTTFKVYLMSDSKDADKIAKTKYNGQIAVSNVKKVHVDQAAHMPMDYVLQGFIGLMVNIEVAAKGAVFVRAKESTVSDLIESIVQAKNGSVIKPY